MKRILTFVLFFAVISATAQSVVTGFSLLDVTSGEEVSLDKFSGKPAVVVIFTSNECPFDNSYAERLSKLVVTYSDKLPILLVNSHLDPQESEENMKKEAGTWGFRAPYLSDKNQVAMAALDARRSPEGFVLKPTNGGFQVYYSGAIDDNPQTPGAVTASYLQNAIDNALAGKPAPASVRAAGCSIRRR